MKVYLAVIESTDTGYSAYIPDVDGVVATSSTRAGVLRDLENALEDHLCGMKEDVIPLPKASTATGYVYVNI